MKNLIPLFFIILTSVPGWSSPTAIFEEGVKWPKNKIEVCWASLDEYRQHDSWWGDKVAKVKINYITSSMRQKIREKITSQFTVKRAGIEFTGWGMCDDSPNADVFILALDQLPTSYQGLSTVGSKMDVKAKSTMFLNRSKDTEMMDADEKMELSALHEFGHLAGLRHEHLRSAGRKDPNCRAKLPAKYSTIEKNELNSKWEYIGAYDPESIMNYCYLWTLESDLGGGDLIKLSLQDRITLVCMYTPERLDPKYCVKHSLIEEIEKKK